MTEQVRDTRRRILDSGQRLVSRRAYSAVGLNEILGDARVPKGSFYHYFSSKDAFGEEMLREYFRGYLAGMDGVLGDPAVPDPAQRLMNYWAGWRESQSFEDCQGGCLAVKLGAEVADLSDAMREALRTGTDQIVDRITAAIEAGVTQGSLTLDDDPRTTAAILYDIWFGASVLAKIHRDPAALHTAEHATRRLLGLSGSAGTR